MSETINFGIDLGTTNSAIAKYKDGKVEVFKNPRNLKQTLPSVVGFKGDRVIIGDKANELLQKSPQNVFGYFKRKMGTSDSYFVEELNNFQTPINLSSTVLKELKNFVHTDETIDSVVITIPAAFDTMQSNATKKAGYEAGFKEVLLLQEPIAASLAFANNTELQLSKKWLIYDFGGGTFDIALGVIQDEEMKIIDHLGDNYLGGTEIDKAIIDKFIIPALEEKGSFANLDAELKKSSGKYNSLYNKLLFKAEEAKIELSNTHIAEIEFDIIDDNNEEIDIFLELKLEEFENIVAPIVEKTTAMIDEILDTNEVDPTDLEYILMIGGTTYIPSLRKIIDNHTAANINIEMDPTTAVVVGAAYYAGLKPKTVKEVEKKAVKENTLSTKIAYQRVVQDIQSLVLLKATSIPSGAKFRISRSDGGFDTGWINLSDTNTINISLLPNGFNSFTLQIIDGFGDTIKEEDIAITHGKFGIDGQPLPNTISLEVDDTSENTTYLEPIFLKNDILPLRKTITKQVSKTIYKNSKDKLIIKVLEGPIDTLPFVNKTIGVLEINGNDIERDLIKSTDIDLTFEISESRDVKVTAYLSLIDQELENTFTPSSFNVSKNILLAELQNIETNIQKKHDHFMNQEDFTSLGNLQKIQNEIDELKISVNNLSDDDSTDLKYQLEIRKRELGQKVHQFYNKSLLTKYIDDYLTKKVSLD